MIAIIISTNVNKSSYVTYISTTPFARLRNGWIRPPSCLGKYIIFCGCPGQLWECRGLYNEKDPVAIRDPSCAGKLHCPNVIHAKLFCSITLYTPLYAVVNWKELLLVSHQFFFCEVTPHIFTSFPPFPRETPLYNLFRGYT